jgi:hypothetical protein
MMEIKISISRRSFTHAGSLILAASTLPIRMFSAQTQLAAVTQPPDKKYQAKAPPTRPFDPEAFEPSDQTAIGWLGNAGFFINSCGATQMVDPLLEGFDLPLLIDMPILAEDVPHL